MTDWVKFSSATDDLDAALADAEEFGFPVVVESGSTVIGVAGDTDELRAKVMESLTKYTTAFVRQVRDEDYDELWEFAHTPEEALVVLRVVGFPAVLEPWLDGATHGRAVIRAIDDDTRAVVSVSLACARGREICIRRLLPKDSTDGRTLFSPQEEEEEEDEPASQNAERWPAVIKDAVTWIVMGAIVIFAGSHCSGCDDNVERMKACSAMCKGVVLEVDNGRCRCGTVSGP